MLTTDTLCRVFGLLIYRFGGCLNILHEETRRGLAGWNACDTLSVGQWCCGLRFQVGLSKESLTQLESATSWPSRSCAAYPRHAFRCQNRHDSRR